MNHLDAIRAHLKETTTTEAALEGWLLDGNVVETPVVAEALDNARVAGYMAGELFEAVEAVLAIHVEVGNGGLDGCDCGCGGYEPWCMCGDENYPCPTVVAIQSALGEESK